MKTKIFSVFGRGVFQFAIAILLLGNEANAQNVSINTTGAVANASALLDVGTAAGGDTKGILIPRVALTALGTYLPVTGAGVDGLLIYNTATGVGNGSGYYYWSTTVSQWINLLDNYNPGGAWLTLGNSGLNPANNFLGNIDAVDLVFKTTNTERMRILSGGNVGIGIAGPTYLFHVTKAVAVPGAVSLVQNTGTGDALRAYSTAVAGYGSFWGDNSSSNAGTGYGITSSVSAIQGQIATAGNYGFAVVGQVGGATGRRIGGIAGYGPYVGQWACLGYQTSGNVAWAVYYSNNGATGGITTGTGRMMNPDTLIASGMGIGGYADLLGAGIKGGKYGMYIQGDRVGLYADGKLFTNDIIAKVTDVPNGRGERIVSYVSTSTSVDVYTKGTATLSNGRAFVKFDENYRKIVSSEKPIIVTATPMGKSNGVYIESVSPEGFTIAENNDGKSNTQFSWIAVATQKGYENPETPKELLSSDFEKNMRKVINDESDTKSENQAMWWDGLKLNFGSLPENVRTLQKIKSEDLTGEHK